MWDKRKIGEAQKGQFTLSSSALALALAPGALPRAKARLLQEGR